MISQELWKEKLYQMQLLILTYFWWLIVLDFRVKEGNSEMSTGKIQFHKLVKMEESAFWNYYRK